jgi:hypothetical protein
VMGQACRHGLVEFRGHPASLPPLLSLIPVLDLATTVAVP